MDVYNFSVEDEPYEVIIVSLKKNIAEVQVNGIKYKLNINEMGRLKEVVPMTPIQHESRPVSPEIKKAVEPKKEVGVSGKDISSPMPGYMLKILVSEGDNVEVGDIVAIIEAMKMENQIKSTVEGKVIKIHIKEGDNVLEGAPLVSIRG